MKAKTKSIPVTKDKTDITLKQKTFIITKRAAGVPIKEIQEQWKSHFERTPPECRTIIRIYQKAISENSIESKKCNSGRKRTVRTKEIIAEVKEVSDVDPSTVKEEEIRSDYADIVKIDCKICNKAIEKDTFR